MNHNPQRRIPYIVPDLDLGKAFVMLLVFLAMLYVGSR